MMMILDILKSAAVLVLVWAMIAAAFVL